MNRLRNIFFVAFVVVFFVPAGAMAEQRFDKWVENFKNEAVSKGVSRRTVDVAFENVKPIARVIELDRKQPEGRMSFKNYFKHVVNEDRVKQGRRLYREHKELLDSTAKKFGVPAQYIVALWGIETSYGNNTGGFGVISALATLAYDGRRSDFFRSELINALKILDSGHISLSDMKGSWAGAMGQNQFMPSSFHAFAIDGNGDGKRDIWKNLPDVFASTANYLSKSGWKEDYRWGRRVKLPSGILEDMIGVNIKHNLKDLKKMGVTLPSGDVLPVIEGMSGAIVAPDGLSGATYVVYDNYDVIMKWNKSTYFATSVGLLADQIAQP